MCTCWVENNFPKWFNGWLVKCGSLWAGPKPQTLGRQGCIKTWSNQPPQSYLNSSHLSQSTWKIQDKDRRLHLDRICDITTSHTAVAAIHDEIKFQPQRGVNTLHGSNNVSSSFHILVSESRVCPCSVRCVQQKEAQSCLLCFFT